MSAIARKLAYLDNHPSMIEYLDLPLKGDAANLPDTVTINDAFVNQYARLWEPKEQPVANSFF